MDIDIVSLFNHILDDNVKISISLEDKLGNLKYPLQEYLNDPDAIECFKKMGKNTKKYFRPEIVKNLIKYITEEPENDDFLRGHKFPYIASEILKSDCSYVQDLFVLSEKEYNNKYKKNKKEENNDKIENKENAIKIIDKKDKEEKKLKKESKNNTNTNIINEINNEIFHQKEDKQEEILIDEDKVIKTNDKGNNRDNKKEKENEVNKIILVNKENNDCKKNNKEKKLDLEKNTNELMNKDLKEEKNKNNMPKKIKNEFLDLLLNFVKSKQKKLNHILCGYFSEVLIALIDKYPFEMLNYFYKIRKDALRQIIYHSYQKSISMIASKLLQLGNHIIKEKLMPEKIEYNIHYLYTAFNNYRYELFIDILFSITLDGIKDKKGIIKEDLDVENMFNILYDLLEDSNFVMYITKDFEAYFYIIDILGKNLFGKNENNKKQQSIYILFLKFLTKMVRTINESKDKYFIFIKDSENFECINNNNLFYYYLLNTVTNITKNFVDLSSINDNSKNKLGIHNIYIMDYIIEMFKYMKLSPINMDTILISCNFVSKSLLFFLKYELNNIYHLKFINLFKLYLNNISAHSELTNYLFYSLSLHELLAGYIISVNEVKKNYKSKKYKFDSNYPYIIELMYMIQAKSGLKTFDEKEKKLLDIKNLGEFEFLKDENSKNDIIENEVSQTLADILNSSDKWKTAIYSILLPLIRKYEEKLYNSNIKDEKNENIISEEDLKKYNDVNFWQVKISIDYKYKDKIKKEEKKNNSKNDIIDEEEELLRIVFQLENKEKKKNNKNKKNKKISSKKNKTKKSKSESKKKITNKSKSSEKKTENNNNNNDKKKPSISKKTNKKKVRINSKKPTKLKKKKTTINKYNDVNFWKTKPEKILSEDEIKNIFDDL